MQAISEVVNIKNNNNPTVEYIENELKTRGIEPLRWAVVAVSEEFYTISVAKLVE
ncbi:MAG: hypothetical protein MJ231_06850 [bacterium]|nr:hypothetical protein [bacterium]